MLFKQKSRSRYARVDLELDGWPSCSSGPDYCSQTIPIQPGESVAAKLVGHVSIAVTEKYTFVPSTREVELVAGVQRLLLA